MDYSKEVREEPGFIGVYRSFYRSLEHQKVTVNERKSVISS